MGELAKISAEKEFTPCCDAPPGIDCCGCDDPDNLMSTIWVIQDAPGMYSPFVTGSSTNKFVWGCEQFDLEDIRRLTLQHGPHNIPPETQGNCIWYSIIKHAGMCCQFSCTDPGPLTTTYTENGSAVAPGRFTTGALLSCQKFAAVDPVPPTYMWHLDCADPDGLYCGDDSEWSAADCKTYDTNCHACTPGGANYATQVDALADKAYLESLGYTCSDPTYIMTDPGSPGTPAYVSYGAGYYGACGCNRSYIFLNPNDPACATLIGDMSDSSESDFPEWQCQGCNTFVLLQFRPTGETNPHCNTCIVDGADGGCQTPGSEFGLASAGYGCAGYPATITLCPADSVNYPDDTDTNSDSECADPLCCDKEPPGEVDAEFETLGVDEVEPPENAIHWSIKNTSSQGYLLKDTDGLYKGGLFPFTFSVDKEAKTLNGKPIKMYGDDLFWGFIWLGGAMGIPVEVMA